MTYGGLRGAIGISFALIVASDAETYTPTLRHFILFDMAGCAFLTLISKDLYAYFGLIYTQLMEQQQATLSRKLVLLEEALSSREFS